MTESSFPRENGSYGGWHYTLLSFSPSPNPGLPKPPLPNIQDFLYSELANPGNQQLPQGYFQSGKWYNLFSHFFKK